MNHLGLLLLPLAVITASAGTSYLQHRYYRGVVRETAAQFDDPGLYLVSGAGRGRVRGAVAVLVLRRLDGVIEHAEVMRGGTILARFKPRPLWVGLPASGPLPGAGKHEVRAITQALGLMPRTEPSAPAPPSGPVLRGAMPSPRAGL